MPATLPQSRTTSAKSVPELYFVLVRVLRHWLVYIADDQRQSYGSLDEALAAKREAEVLNKKKHATAEVKIVSSAFLAKAEEDWEPAA